MTGNCGERLLPEGDGRGRILSLAQALVWYLDSPARSAMAFQCLRISSAKGILRFFQMPTTVSSGNSSHPSASDAIRQPETLPLGGIPTLRRTSMVN